MSYAAIPYIIAAVGTAVTVKSQMDAADRQDAAIKSSLAEQDAKQRQINNVIAQNVSNYEPATRQERMAQGTDAASQSLTQALDTAYASLPKEGSQGALSREFLVADASRQIGDANRAMQFARLMGKIRGPTSMMTAESNMNTDYGNQARILANAANGLGRVSNIRIGESGRVDPLMSGIGGIMQGVGSAMGSGWLGSGGSSGVTPLGRMMGVGSTVTYK